ncbi:hypothetical protein B5S28_g2000 [[Candida] boidinii]|nr:hypothetical protein B5S28_g2000 [[Candida] boidinii]OWB75649.1 hypothetical protein B5S31_g5581 [[Candida] boidinii]GME81023.1 unnamed protein product [[Candida] boidinii]
MTKPNKSESSLLNLGEQLAFYRAYHFNKVNVAIHLVCIPIIFFSYILIFSYFSFESYLPFDLPKPLSNFANLGSVIGICYSIYYCLLDKTGYYVTPLIIYLSYYFRDLYDYNENNYLLKYGFLINTISWIMQFIGHGHYEKRAPALLDNLVQALVLAPYFVAFEVVFFFGGRTDLQKDMNNKAGVLRRDFVMKAHHHEPPK